MTDQERNDYLESRGIDILDVGENVDDVLKEVWDEAQRQVRTPLQPIETAPRDGEWILLAHKDEYGDLCAQSGFWSICHNGWRDFRDDSCDVAGFEPTHWMPAPTLPPAPKTLSDSLSDFTLRFDLDEEALDIICRAVEQLHKQEQADD